MEKNPEGKQARPIVGVGVVILNKENKILLGKRKNAHGAGEWCFPGGHLEFGETIFETAEREVLEETGLVIKKFKLISVFDEMRYIPTDGKHVLNIGVQGYYEDGEPQLREPNKCEGWEWFSLDALPENLFEPSMNTLENLKNGVIYKFNN